MFFSGQAIKGGGVKPPEPLSKRSFFIKKKKKIWTTNVYL